MRMAPRCKVEEGGDPAEGDDAETGTTDSRIIVTRVGDPPEQEEEDGIKPLSDRLMTELTAYRTLALREAVGHDPAIAYLAVLHALCLKLFYRYGLEFLPGDRAQERGVWRPSARPRRHAAGGAS